MSIHDGEPRGVLKPSENLFKNFTKHSMVMHPLLIKGDATWEKSKKGKSPTVPRAI